MHSKRRYKICIYSVILGELIMSLFEITKASVIIFPKLLDAIKLTTKVNFLLIPLSIAFSNPKIRREFIR